MSASANAACDRQVPRWHNEFHAALQATDPTPTDRFSTDDVTVRMGKIPEVKGREARRETIKQLGEMFGGMRHRFVHVIDRGDEWVLEAMADYERLDGAF